MVKDSESGGLWVTQWNLATDVLWVLWMVEDEEERDYAQ